MDEFKIPFGKTKGTPLNEASEDDIMYIVRAMKKSLAEDPEHKFAQQNKTWMRAAKAELDKRNGKTSTALAPQQPPAQSITVAEPSAMAVVGAFGDPGKATDALLQAQQHYHVITPAMSVGGIPEGCEIYTAMVVVDPYGAEVYTIVGDRKAPKDDDTVGLDRVALMKIAGAAAVTWLVSRRTDDRSHPFYCAWEAILEYKQFDGSVCRVPGNVDIDVRPGGAAYMEIMEKAKGRDRDGEKQLLELRKFLMRHCESKAMSKAIGNMGVKRSYKRSQLKKPFLVARLAATGRSNDPELQREFSKMKFQQLISANQVLYPSAALSPPHIDETQLLAPPTVSAHGYEDDDQDDLWADLDTTAEEKPASEPKAAAQPQGEQPAGTTQAAGAGQQGLKL